MNFVFYRFATPQGDGFGNCAFCEPIRSMGDIERLQRLIEEKHGHAQGAVIVSGWRPFDGRAEEDCAEGAAACIGHAGGGR